MFLLDETPPVLLKANTCIIVKSRLTRSFGNIQFMGIISLFNKQNNRHVAFDDWSGQSGRSE